jgi:hypothetical protein
MKIKLTEIQLRRLLEEAISDEIANKYINTEREENINEVLDEVFDSLKQNEEYIQKYENLNPERLYFKLSEKNNIYKKVILAINEINQVQEKQYNINNELFNKGKINVTYIDGLGNKKTQEQKLQSTLSKYEDIINNKNLIQDLSNYYSSNSGKENVKNESDYILVISRNKRDITEMTGGRDWTSCMNCESGIYREKIKADIAHGTLIAYIIEPNDLEIKNPLGRVLIKPFLSVNDENDVYYKSESKIYSKYNINNIVTIDYVDSLFKNYNSTKSNFPYKKHIKLYNDSRDEDAVIEKPNFEKRLMLLSDNPNVFNKYLNKIINNIPDDYIPPIKIIELINKNEIFKLRFKYSFESFKKSKNSNKEKYEDMIISFINNSEEKNIEYGYDDYTYQILDIFFKNGIIDMDYLPDNGNLLDKLLNYYPLYNKDFINKLNKNKELIDDDKLNFYLDYFILCDLSDKDKIITSKLILYVNVESFINIVNAFIFWFNKPDEFLISLINQYFDKYMSDNLAYVLIIQINGNEKILNVFLDNEKFLNTVKNNDRLKELIKNKFGFYKNIMNKIENL